MDEHGARNRHSDKEKFLSDLNCPKSFKTSERLLKTLQKFGDFQAEYEGSIPFIRSSYFIDLARRSDFDPAIPAKCPSRQNPMGLNLY